MVVTSGIKYRLRQMKLRIFYPDEITKKGFKAEYQIWVISIIPKKAPLASLYFCTIWQSAKIKFFKLKCIREKMCKLVPNLLKPGP